jgi:hypothetical protein
MSQPNYRHNERKLSALYDEGMCSSLKALVHYKIRLVYVT